MVKAGKGLEEDVEIDPPSVRQAIAWEFALANVRRTEVIYSM